jgi:hypothetical protein
VNSVRCGVFAAFIALLSCSCTLTANDVMAPGNLSVWAPIQVRFLSGQSGADGDIGDAVVPGDGLWALRQNLKILSASDDGVRYDIVGFTDDAECEGNKCIELSCKRAQAVYEWLLMSGLDKSVIRRIDARGSENPIDFNSEPGGRANNRRVEFSEVRD